MRYPATIAVVQLQLIVQGRDKDLKCRVIYAHHGCRDAMQGLIERNQPWAQRLAKAAAQCGTGDLESEIAWRCGAKPISKSKVPKTEGFGALLDVQMSFCVAGARACARCQK